MLIQFLNAKNFQGHNTLTITDIPRQGIIAIHDSEQSETSNIADVICFGLFGHTLHINQENTTKLIQLDAEAAVVSLAFCDSDQDYLIQRHINHHGNNQAKLIKRDTKAIIAEGVAPTNDAIIKLIGFEYSTFINSFYFTAKDLTPPSYKTIKDIAEVSEYASISKDLTAEIAKDQTEIDALSPSIQDKQEKLSAINLNETWLAELIDTRENLDINIKQKQTLNDHLIETPNIYHERQTASKRTHDLRSLLTLCLWCLVPLLLTTLSIWGCVQFFSGGINTFIQQSDTSQPILSIYNWGVQWSFTVGMSLVLITSMTLCIKWFIEQKREHQLSDINEFSSVLSKALIHSQHSLEHLITSPVLKTLQGTVHNQSFPVLPNNDCEITNDVIQACQNFTTQRADIEKISLPLSDTLTRQIKILQILQGRLDSQIKHEKRRSDQAGTIRSKLKSTLGCVSQTTTQINIKKMGVEILYRASEGLINDFNTTVKEDMNRTLFLFTQGHYSQLKIEKDFSVHIYSEKKMNWISVTELPQDLQQQITLATYIIISTQAARSTQNNQQFIFLDAPFSCLNQTEIALNALHKLNETTNQIWVVAHQLPEKPYINQAAPTIYKTT